MSKPLTLLATIYAKPEHAVKVGELLTALAAASRAEAGCVNYDLHRSTRSAGEWIVYENWKDQAALDVHAAAPHYKVAGAALNGLLAKATDLHILEMTTKLA